MQQTSLNLKRPRTGKPGMAKCIEEPYHLNEMKQRKSHVKYSYPLTFLLESQGLQPDANPKRHSKL